MMNDIDEEEVIEIVLITFEIIYVMFSCNGLFIYLMWFIKIKYINGENWVVIRTRETLVNLYLRMIINLLLLH